MFCTVANLDGKKLEELKSLEQRLGRTLVAFSCSDMKVPQLEDKELKEIKEAESRLGVALVAVK